MKTSLQIVLFLFCSSFYAQKTLILRVTDQFQKPLAFTVVRTNVATYTADQSGTVLLQLIQDTKFTLHKFGFADTSLTVRPSLSSGDTIQVLVRMRLKPAVLPEVSVLSKPFTEINPASADFIRDYELYNGCLLELLDNGSLLLIDVNGLVLCRSQKYKGMEAIVKDKYGKIFLRGKSRALELKINRDPLNFDTSSVDLRKLDWNLQYCHAVTDENYYISRFKDINQTVAYFGVSRVEQQQAHLLREITDAERKKSALIYAGEATAFNQMVADLGINIMTASNDVELKMARQALDMANMMELHYALPSYNFLCKVQDQICLFAHDIDSLLVFDPAGPLARACRISYHHLKYWGKELVEDEELTRVFARITREGQPQLVQVNLQSGDLFPVSTPIYARFPEKIRVRGNLIYYLAKSKSGPGFTVYSQELSSVP